MSQVHDGVGDGPLDGSPAHPIPRRAARILVVDAAGRLLMFRGLDPARPDVRYWFTAGGGLAEGESMAEGAVRELFEETGLAVSPCRLGEAIWHEVTDIPFDGLWYRQEQDFFALRVESWQVSIDGFDDQERVTIDDHRWWTLAELVDSEERYYPAELPILLRGILGV